MKNRLLPGILVFILVITSLLISCTNTTTPSTSSTSTTSTPTQTVTPTTTTATQSNWWDTFGTPKYGGTINIQASSQGSVFDPWVATPNSMLYQNETLVTPDWTVDRKVWAMDSPFVPLKYYMGLLAKSWEKTDATTLVFHLREGVHWQNKPPVNGREFVADDVVQHYNRILGTGSGYTQPSSVSGTISLLASVTATDKYTVTFKFKNSSLLGMFQLFDSGNENAIENPEAAKVTKTVAAAPGPPGPPAPGGDSQASTEGLGDWHNAAGTGAWMLDEFVAGSSVTLNKNPDYYGYDERHPDNKLPYADTLKVLVIPDNSTALAALRTAKIDYFAPMSLGWQQATNLMNTNPELKYVTTVASGTTLEMRVDKAPFTDINVRKALNMAIDRDAIAKGYYGGTVQGTPCGMLSPTFAAYSYAYSEWSQEDKDGYSYNPTAAKKLLADAGYPTGFKTNVVASSIVDTSLLELIKAELADISVDVEIKMMDFASFQAYAVSMKHDQMVDFGYPGVGANSPLNAVYFRSSKPGSINVTANNDAGYDALITKLETVTTDDEMTQTLHDIDKYNVEHYWSISVFPIQGYVFYQPRLKGFMGDAASGGGGVGFAMAASRWFLDENNK